MYSIINKYIFLHFCLSESTTDDETFCGSSEYTSFAKFDASLCKSTLFHTPSSVYAMFRSPTHEPPDGSFNQPLHLPALFVDLAKHKTLELDINRVNLDSTCHTCCQLISVTEKFVAIKVGHLVNPTICTDSAARWKWAKMQTRCSYLHHRLIIADLGAPLLNTLGVLIIREVLAVHNMIEGRRHSGLDIQLGVFWRASEAPFHGALKAFERGGIFRHSRGYLISEFEDRGHLSQRERSDEKDLQ